VDCLPYLLVAGPGVGRRHLVPQLAERLANTSAHDPLCHAHHRNAPPTPVGATRRHQFGLLAGLGFAILLIYLLIVVNFQSWLDPFIIISALPAALAGIVWMLFVTHTTISVPALTGSIMCMGVATANTILVVSFSKERVQEGLAPLEAAEEAGFTRFRPVIMTAMAMIIGMLPMAVGLGEGGEQNAPLGRAVIGGLIFATVATLLFVPSVYSLIHGFRNNPGQSAEIEIPGE